MDINFELLARQFVNAPVIEDFIPYGGGHINDTYRFKAGERYYILQRINKYVFKRPEDIMDNIIGVTNFLREKIEASGGDTARETLRFLPAYDGKYYVIDDKGDYWRVMDFIDNSTAYESASDLTMLEKSGFAFGQFQNLLADYPADTLHEVIKDFHNTPERVNQLLEAIKNNASGRADEVKAEIEFAISRTEAAAELTKLLAEGKLPLKVTHNDTKMSNILIDNDTNEAICVIDLDTVMPGLAAYDYGDSIRAGASTAAEDETDLAKVNFSLEKFEAYTKGFLKAAGKALTATELETLPVGAKLMTYEVGIRFLADYINGDVYFKTAYPQHNLDRCRNQFKLVKDMEDNWTEIMSVIHKHI